MRTALAVSIACALLTPLAAAAQEEKTERVRFETGKSSAEIHGTLALDKEGHPETDTLLLGASAGQRMTVRFASTEPETTYRVACPGGGLTDAGASPWSFELPEPGDYRITVSGPYEAGKSIPYLLDVAIEGKPHPVAPQGLTGTYGLVEDPDSTIEIRQLPDGRLTFHLLALWKGANWKEYGPNLGEAFGTVRLEKNRAVYHDDQCTLAMVFANDSVTINETGDCGFGHNVHADGTYRRVSLCAAPEAGAEGR